MLAVHEADGAIAQGRNGDQSNQQHRDGQAAGSYEFAADGAHIAERPELRHAGPNDVNREAELDRPSRVACSELLNPAAARRA